MDFIKLNQVGGGDLFLNLNAVAGFTTTTHNGAVVSKIIIDGVVADLMVTDTLGVIGEKAATAGVKLLGI